MSVKRRLEIVLRGRWEGVRAWMGVNRIKTPYTHVQKIIMKILTICLKREGRGQERLIEKAILSKFILCLYRNITVKPL
jgi:hypothetical protein